MPSELAFVDTISATPTTDLNLNDQSVFWLDEFDAPPPALRRSLSSSMLTDGEDVSSGAYDNRQLRLTWRLMGNADATATAIQNLGRQLDAPTNLLRYKPLGATSPVFFQTYRSSIANIVERTSGAGVRTLELSLLAKPFALGLAVDTGFLAFTNNPSSGTRPCFYPLPAIIGDVESPLLVYSDPADTDIVGGWPLMQSVAFDGVTMSTLYRAELSSLTAGTAVGAATGADTYIVNQYRRWTFTLTGTEANAVRLSGTVTPALTPPPGVYKVLLRYRATFSAASGSTTLTLKVGQSTDLGSSTWEFLSRDFVLASTAPGYGPGWVDMGDMAFPHGYQPTKRGEIPTPTAAGPAPVWRIEGSRTGATATGGYFDFDEIVLLPIDVVGARSIRTSFTSIGIAVVPRYNSVVWDGINDNIQFLVGSDPSTAVPASGIPPSRTGGLPSVVPGLNNYITFLRTGAAPWAQADDLVAMTTTLAFRYWPRYLYVRPATT